MKSLNPPLLPPSLSYSLIKRLIPPAIYSPDPYMTSVPGVFGIPVKHQEKDGPKIICRQFVDYYSTCSTFCDIQPRDVI